MALPANPLTNPSAFDFLLVGDQLNTGIARLTDGGGRPYNWDVKDTAGAQGATTTYRGFKNSEHIKFRFEFWLPEQIEEFFNNYLPLLQYDATKTSPKPIAIYHPVLSANNITTVVTNEIGPLVDLGGQLWSVTVEFIEYRPAKKKNVTTTPTSPSTSGKDQGTKPTVEDERQKRNAELLNQWKAPLPGQFALRGHS